ncbi:MAG: polysaccharide pyruvyl transferase CsaB [Peptostreptococcales bacterium]|jgi:polysaccharide pyruvyl transferase CsaB
MHKIVISGYYGFNNIGDESILKAVVNNLREEFESVDITVLSQDPALTQEKFGIRAIDRMNIINIIMAIKSCDLLISGGGSLLQDSTSKRSILYYIGIIWISLLFKKKVFIYSQGIGPITQRWNRKLVKKVLNRLHYIVVRDVQSKELLCEIGVDKNKIYVTADPVISLKPVSLEAGRLSLIKAGLMPDSQQVKVGIALRGLKIKDEFVTEIIDFTKEIIHKYNAKVVFIPFHFNEDMPIIEKMERILGDKCFYIKNKHLTEEMLSIIGNMDLLIGVRLHSLIHAAIMDIPMIAIAYDPKINSFMHALNMKALCSIYDLKSEFLLEEFERVQKEKEHMQWEIKKNINQLVEDFKLNQRLIKDLLEEKK